MSDVDVVVIGAGQAGLSAAYHLRRRGLAPYRHFVVLDANGGPGGAWQHRWPSLTLGRAHRVYDLPGLPLDDPDPPGPAPRRSPPARPCRSPTPPPTRPPPGWSPATTRSTSVGSGCRSSDRS